MIRTNVWGIGCLMLYIYWFSYSPYEITFDKNGHVPQSDCTYLRILSSSIPVAPNTSKQDKMPIKMIESQI